MCNIFYLFYTWPLYGTLHDQKLSAWPYPWSINKQEYYMYAVKFIYLSRGNFHTSHTKLNVSKNLLLSKEYGGKKISAQVLIPKHWYSLYHWKNLYMYYKNITIKMVVYYKLHCWALQILYLSKEDLALSNKTGDSFLICTSIFQCFPCFLYTRAKICTCKLAKYQETVFIFFLNSTSSTKNYHWFYRRFDG